MGVHWEHLACSLVLIILSFCQYLLLIQPFIHHDFLILCAVGVGTSNIVLLLMTALSDPGIRPRQLFRTDMATSVGLIKKDATILKSNFCKVCNIWRPSRTRHCKFCDNCVDIFDHHCPVIVNYFIFYYFTFDSLNLLSLIISILIPVDRNMHWCAKLSSLYSLCYQYTRYLDIIPRLSSLYIARMAFARCIYQP